MWTVGAELGLVDVGSFIDEAVAETDLLQGGEHFHVAAVQWLGLEVVQAFAQLSKQLLETFEKTFALAVHLFAFAQLHLTQSHAQAAGQQ
ncbi:hypothetical protein D3C81_2035840 [compost metagenome]